MNPTRKEMQKELKQMRSVLSGKITRIAPTDEEIFRDIVTEEAYLLALWGYKRGLEQAESMASNENSGCFLSDNEEW